MNGGVVNKKNSGVWVAKDKFLSQEQVCIHDRISRERWAGALMEVKSLLSLNSAI